MTRLLHLLLTLRLRGLVMLTVLATGSLGSAQTPSLPDNGPALAALSHLLREFDVLDHQLGERLPLPGGVHRVRPGETLDGIIERSALADLPLRRSILRQAFVAANPHAFRQGSPHFMFAGAELRSPGADDLRSVVFTQAPAMPASEGPSARSRAHWIRYP